MEPNNFGTCCLFMVILFLPSVAEGFIVEMPSLEEANEKVPYRQCEDEAFQDITGTFRDVQLCQNDVYAVTCPAGYALRPECVTLTPTAQINRNRLWTISAYIQCEKMVRSPKDTWRTIRHNEHLRFLTGAARTADFERATYCFAVGFTEIRGSQSVDTEVGTVPMPHHVLPQILIPTEQIGFDREGQDQQVEVGTEEKLDVDVVAAVDVAVVKDNVVAVPSGFKGEEEDDDNGKAAFVDAVEETKKGELKAQILATISNVLLALTVALYIIAILHVIKLAASFIGARNRKAESKATQ